MAIRKTRSRQLEDINFLLRKNKERNSERLYENGIWVIPTKRYAAIAKDTKLYCFTVEQANDLGVEYHKYPEWYNGKVGEYIETSDGYVIMVLNRNDNPKFPYISTYFGTYSMQPQGIRRHTERGDVNTILRKSRGRVGGNVIPPDNRLTEKQKLFALYVSANILAFGKDKRYEVANYVYGKVVEKIKVDGMYLSRKIQKEIVMNLRDALAGAQITDEWAFERMKEMVEDESVPHTLKWEIIQEILFLSGAMISKVAQKGDFRWSPVENGRKPIDGRIDEQISAIASNSDIE